DAGADYEIARESVNVSGAAPLYKVPIYLRLKVGADPALANIPMPAIELYQKGVASAQKGDSKKAVEQLNSAVAIYPNFPQALSDLGHQYFKLGQMAKAGETFEALLKLKP